MKTKPKTIKSVRELARLVERPPSTVCDWTKRSDWPWATSPPWPLAIVPDIVEWSEELSSCRWDGPTQLVSSPGHKFTARDMIDPQCPFRAEKLIGPELFAEQTTQDLTTLAAVTAIAIDEALRATAAKLGEEFCDPAPQAYWGRLWEVMIKDADLRDNLQECLHRLSMYWLARRYYGVKGWSKRLPDPQPDESIETYFKGEPPLPHRAGGECPSGG